MADWETTDSKIVYENPWMKVREDKIIRPGGAPGMYGYLVHRSAGVMVIPVSPDGELYLISQYRYPVGKTMWEFPSGSSEGKDILEAAAMELKEESGMTSPRLQRIGTSYSMPGLSSLELEIVIAWDAVETGKDIASMHDEGIGEVMKTSFNEALAMAYRGDIICGETLACLCLATPFLSATA